MDVFTMVVIVVVVGCAAGVLNNFIEAKKKEPDLEQDEGLSVQVDELRGRVEVLEKIVTDGKYNLSRELDELERHA
jgi:hypothetical protein